MKTLLFWLFNVGIVVNIFGQCPFNPTITPSTLQLCPNSSDTLWTETATTYQWYRGGNPVANSNHPYLVVNSATDGGQNFIVASTINGCTEASPAAAVSVYNPPAIALSVGENLPLTGCEGDPRQLIINDPYNENILWFRNGVQLNGQNNDTLNVNQSGSYSVIAFTDQCPLYSQTSAATVFNFTASQTPVIQFNSGNLSLSTSTIAGSYQWYLDSNPITNATSSTYLPQANGLFTVEAIFSGTCSRYSTPYNYTSFVQECTQDPIVTPSDLVLCPGATDTLFTQAADSYQWYREGVALIGATDSFLVVDAFSAAGAQYSVETTVNGCTEMSPSVLVDGWVFLPIYVISEFPNGETLCEGDSVILTVGNPFTNSISWFKNGSLIEGQSESSYTVTTNGTYTVTAFTGTCPDYGETSLPLDYSFGVAPIPNINFFSVSNSLGTNANAVTYVWNLDGNPISGATNQVYNLGEIGGTYTLTCTYSNGCSNTSLPFIYDPTGIKGVKTLALEIGPNPAKSEFFVELPEDGTLEIWNAAGSLTGSYNLKKGKHVLSTEQRAAGIYMLKFSSSKSVWTARLQLTGL